MATSPSAPGAFADPQKRPLLPNAVSTGADSNKKLKRSAGDDGDDKKAHRCEWPDCNKTFSRVDHLRRHFLNHAPAQIYTCDRCGKVFVRADLLLRHVERHERRETTTEPGSSKPLPISEAARQFAQPPPPRTSIAPPAATPSQHNWPQEASPTQHHQALQNTFYTYQANPATTPFTAASGVNFPFSQPTGTAASGSAPPPPAASTGRFASNFASSVAAPENQQTYLSNGGGSEGSSTAAARNSNDPVYSTTSLSLPSAFSPASLTLFDLPIPGASNPPLPTSSSTSSVSTGNPLPGLEDPLNFIQASYGAPFVSAFEYDWLFDASGNFDVTLGSSRPASPGGDDDGENGFGFGSLGLARGELEISDLDFGPDLEMLNHHANGSGTFGNEGGVFGETPSGAMKDGEGEDASMPSISPPKADDDTTSPASVSNAQKHQGMDVSPLTAVSEPTPTAAPPTTTPTAASEPFVTDEIKPDPTDDDDESHNEDSDFDPSTFVHAQTRLHILDYLGPEWIGLRGDKRMATAQLREYLQLFWERVHETQAPVIHRASFRTELVPIPLLLSMILLGCYFAEPEAHQLAVKLHPHLRGKVICSTDFKPRAQLWLHQTALLIIIFGKLCANRLGHEMAHIHWSSVVTLARRSGLFSQRSLTIPDESKNDLEVQWAYWIEEECAKRLAHIQFAVDVEHAALFRHSPTLSAFQIQLVLPCDEEEWEATTAVEWARIHAQSRAPVPFISALKASLVNGAAPPVLNPFARISILHGLLSVAQDLQWRDHVIGLSQPERRSVHNWRDMISSAYNSWKSRLDSCLLTATWPTSQLLRASISLYATAHITLSIDIHELQIFAGAESALGLVVSPVVYEATTVRMRIWANSKDGRAATWHASHFLRSSLQHWFQTGGDLAGCLHHRWAVYIACLTLFCFGTSTDGPAGPRHPNHREATMKYLDAMCTASPEALVAVPNKNDVVPLCETICAYIQGSRWEIAQEGARILARLVPNWD